MFIRLTTKAGHPMWVDPERVDVVWGEKVTTPASGGILGQPRVEATTSSETHVAIKDRGSWVVQGDPDEIAARVMGASDAEFDPRYDETPA